MAMGKVGLVAALFATLAACGDGDDGGISKTCLTQAAVCQFTNGVSTKQQVQAALGKPYVSQSVSGGGTSLEQWAYLCMPDQQSAQQVQFIFDGNGVLLMTLVVSSGPNAPPAFTCS